MSSNGDGGLDYSSSEDGDKWSANTIYFWDRIYRTSINWILNVRERYGIPGILMPLVWKAVSTLLREIAGVDYGGKINSSLNHVTFHIPPSYDRRVVMKRPVIWPSLRDTDKGRSYQLQCTRSCCSHLHYRQLKRKRNVDLEWRFLWARTENGTQLIVHWREFSYVPTPNCNEDYINKINHAYRKKEPAYCE